MEDKRGKETDSDGEEGRARIYGLQPADLLDHSLVVGPGKYVRLSGEGGESDHQAFVRLVPKNLDDVKRWIGVPDELGTKRVCGCGLPSGFQGVASAAEFRELGATMRRTIHELAYEYVHGDSRRVAAYKPVLDHILDRAVITGVFLRQDIDIHKGAVLEVGSNIKILFARHIRIWKGGLLKIIGGTKIDCVTITGGVSGVLAIKLDQVPLIGQLINQEVARG